MKRIGTRTFGVSALIIGALVLADRFAFYAPKSALGSNRFRLLYGVSNDKAAYLDDFRARIWEHGGGYIPDNVASFLNERLESGRDTREVSAIARFYSCEAGGREGVFITELSDHARRRVAQTVLRDWKSYPQWGMEHGFVLLEGLRQNTYLGKADVHASRLNWPYSIKKTRARRRAVQPLEPPLCLSSIHQTPESARRNALSNRGALM